jgi:hypothetical protein
MVDELGVNAAGLRRRFYLSENPRPDTMEVMVYKETDPACQTMNECTDGKVCVAGHRCAEKLMQINLSAPEIGLWIYEEANNAVMFPDDYLPPAGSKINVAYFRRIN